MGKFFDYDTPVMQWLQKISSIIFCGFFWLVTCIPLITAGASTTAMYRMMFNIREDKPANAADFYRVFAKEFKKSTLLWIIDLLCVISIGLSFYLILLSRAEGARLVIFMVFFFTVLITWGLAFSFVFPLTAYFENTVGGTLKNGLLMSAKHRFQSIPAMALVMIPVIFYMIAPYYFLVLLPIMLFVLIPLIFWWQSGLYLKAFAEYIPDNDGRGTDEVE